MLVHVWSKFTPSDLEGQARHALARSSWAVQHWKELPIEDSALPRMFEEKQKRLPFIRDLFDAAVGQVRDPVDIVVFSNADIGFCQCATARITFALMANEAGYSFRRDIPPRSTLPSDTEIAQGIEYPGTDVFFFTKNWWAKYRSAFPDMLIGREAWDACLRVLMERTCFQKPLSLPDLCWHVRHGGNGHWEDPKNRYSLPGQIHNLSLAKGFMVGMGLKPAAFGIR